MTKGRPITALMLLALALCLLQGCDSFRRLAGRPAEVFRLGDRGGISPGRWADLILLDGEYRVRDVWINGTGVVTYNQVGSVTAEKLEKLVQEALAQDMLP